MRRLDLNLKDCKPVSSVGFELARRLRDDFEITEDVFSASSTNSERSQNEGLKTFSTLTSSFSILRWVKTT